MSEKRPSQEEIEAAKGKHLPDVLGPDLDVLFCGVNPGLYSAAVGHHFARPGNRFWKALFESGLTDELLRPSEQEQLLEYGCGLTNLVDRATAVATELTREELRQGRETLAAKVADIRPRCVAILGVGAYRAAFGERKAVIGLQETRLAGARLWVLPNPSGLNAHYKPAALAELFRHLMAATERWRKQANVAYSADEPVV